VKVVELVRRPDGRVEERPAPARLPSRAVTVLDVNGNLFYAGAWTFGRNLPQVEDADAPAVVLRLRHRTVVGATFLDILGRYADQLRPAGGRLFLTGVGPHVAQQMERTGRLGRDDAVMIYPETPVLFESTEKAIADAQTWLEQLPPRRAEAGSPVATPADERAPGANGVGVLPGDPENAERP
jgi:SulP family sulfate permease